VGFTTQAWPKGADGGVEGHPALPNFAARMTNPSNNIFTQYQRGRPALNDGSVYPRELCYNVSDTERNTNVNLQDEDDTQP
jgi:hypothetical protein